MKRFLKLDHAAHLGKATLMALTAGLLAAHAVNAATLRGEVVGLSDGDTVTVLDATHTQYRIRLAGIDAPEKKQAFGDRSRQSLGDLVFRKQVSVEYDKTDRYGRIVGKVHVGKRDASLEQVKRGLAWHYKAYETDQPPLDRAGYARAEEDARSARRGLWQDRSPMPPWVYRGMRRKP